MYQTDRLYLGAVTSETVETIYSFSNEYDLQINVNGSGKFIVPNTLEEFKGFIEEDQAKFAIKSKESKEIIGYASIDFNLVSGVACPFLFLKKEERGQGLGKELIQELIRISFTEFNVRKVSLTVYEFNEPAIRLYDSVGFEVEGVLREEIYRRGRYWDIYKMGLFRDSSNIAPSPWNSTRRGYERW